MTIEEYKAQPFKYDGNGNPVPISETASIAGKEIAS